jgi:hypothetical protein
MSPDPEAAAQLARLLGVDSSKLSEPDGASEAIDAGFERLVQGLMTEIAASDDVIDRESARDFLDRRLDFLRALLNHEQRSRLGSAVRGKIEAW